MSILNQVKDFVVAKISLLLAGLLIIASSVGYVFFFSTSIVPSLEARSELTDKVSEARASLNQSKEIQAESPETLQKRVTNAQATLAASFNIFLTDAQASQVINGLYANATASGVKITSLESRPISTTVSVTPQPTVRPTLIPSPTRQPTNTTMTPPATGQPTLARPTATRTPLPSPTTVDTSPQLFYLTTLRVQAQGDAQRLLNFGARLRGVSTKGFAISNVTLTQSKTGSILTLDISLYTSPYAATEMPPPSPPPPAAPMARVQKLVEPLCAEALSNRTLQ